MMTHINGKTRVFLDKELFLLKMNKTTQISKEYYSNRILLKWIQYFSISHSQSASHILSLQDQHNNKAKVKCLK